MSVNDGGPAFPHVNRQRLDIHPSAFETFTDGGMSLRDWFVGQALSGLMSAPHDDESGDGWQPASVTGAARNAYGLADAMLKERSKGGKDA